jgi:hypothetical protein
MSDNYFYKEDVALSLLPDRDKCFEYCQPLINAYLQRAKWWFLKLDNREDIIQELNIAIITAINTYDAKEGAKLSTHIWNHFFYAMGNYSKAMKKQYFRCDVQLEDEMIAVYLPEYEEPQEEQEDIEPIKPKGRRRGRPKNQ